MPSVIFAKASVFPNVKHQGICLTARNDHQKYANNTSFMGLHYIFKWIKDHFKYTPFSLLNNIQWVQCPFSYFLRDLSVLVLRLEYLSAYRFRLPFSQNISSPRLVFIQLVTIPPPKNSFSVDEVAPLARLNQSVGHVTCLFQVHGN